jgi:hypothetical protein
MGITAKLTCATQASTLASKDVRICEQWDQTVIEGQLPMNSALADHWFADAPEDHAVVSQHTDHQQQLLRQPAFLPR